MTDNTCAKEYCKEAVWDQCPKGYCLYHSPDNGKDVETARKVWKEARRRVEENYCVFAGWHFPEDPDRKSFEKVTFQKDALFFEATFAGNVIFSESVFKLKAFFQETVFEANVKFTGATFDGPANFRCATFKGYTSFDSVTHKGDADFFEARFAGYVHFKSTAYKGRVGFDCVCFESVVGFVRTIFEGEVSFFAAKAFGEFHILPPPKGRGFRRREQGEEAYRLAKQSAHNRGDFEREGYYHYAERCASWHGRWKEDGWQIRHPWRFIRCWGEFIFARLGFGYGEKPIWVLGWGLGVIVFWAALCFGMNGIEASIGDAGGFGNCLYFSTVTFTTLGYGDFRPTPGFRLWAAAEAGIGAALMATFIVSLARKYTR